MTRKSALCELEMKMLLMDISQYESHGSKPGPKCSLGFRLFVFLVILLFLLTKSLKILLVSAPLFLVYSSLSIQAMCLIGLLSTNNNGYYHSL